MRKQLAPELLEPAIFDVKEIEDVKNHDIKIEMLTEDVDEGQGSTYQDHLGICPSLRFGPDLV